MDGTTARSAGLSLLWTAVATAPLLMPGARRRYGTVAVVVAAFGLASEFFRWMDARRVDRELAMVPRNPDIVRAPHQRASLE
jgi:hypothetical protein